MRKRTIREINVGPPTVQANPCVLPEFGAEFGRFLNGHNGL